MVAVSRSGIALLAVGAAFAASTLAVHGAIGNDQVVGTEVVLDQANQQAPEAPSRRRGISRLALGGAAVGSALVAALVYFGLKVLGTKVIQCEPEETGERVAEELLKTTDRFAVVAGEHLALFVLTYPDGYKEMVEGLTPEEREREAKLASERVQTLFNTAVEEGDPKTHDWHVAVSSLEVRMQCEYARQGSEQTEQGEEEQKESETEQQGGQEGDESSAAEQQDDAED